MQSVVRWLKKSSDLFSFNIAFLGAKTKFLIKPKSDTKKNPKMSLQQYCCWKCSLGLCTGNHGEESGHHWSWHQWLGIHQELPGRGAGAHLLWEGRRHRGPVEILGEWDTTAVDWGVRWEVWEHIAWTQPSKQAVMAVTLTLWSTTSEAGWKVSPLLTSKVNEIVGWLVSVYRAQLQ